MEQDSLKRLKQLISLGALLLVLVHVFWPNLAIDAIALSLILVAILPWLSVLIKSFELPGGWKLEFAEVSKKIIEDKTYGKESLIKHQIVTSRIWETGYYKLYSNGVLVEKCIVKLLANSDKTQVIFPIAFPNEPTNIQIVGDVDARVILLNQGNCTLAFTTSSVDRDVELRISGI